MGGRRVRRHAPGDLAHRCEEREPAGLVFHGFVRDADRSGLEQRVGHVAVRRQMKVREQDLALAERVELLRLGLLDLQDQVRARPDLFRGAGECRACARERIVGDRRSVAGAAFHEDGVPFVHELVDADGGDRDPVLGLHDLARNTDDHRSSLTRPLVTAVRSVSVGDRALGRFRDRHGL